ncbi:2061_t:CDS:2 [Cetraspora pellucida]|uniref:2061_t:CDS:1 n=1 Tax=Cetraspora pellucida TaxID=1433469 RepID=A0A9N9FMB4_9GLOM|nr:2061_t:CDS:2 [Cetraspora pellucida]
MKIKRKHKETEIDINKNNILHECTKYHYKALIKQNKNNVLSFEEIAEELFSKIFVVAPDKYFENEAVEINFKSSIILDNFKNKEDTPQEIAKKIINLIDDNNDYYYIYFNCYNLKKNNKLHMF